MGPDRPLGRKPRVLHVSADFPDAFSAAKTPVIERLVGLTDHRLDNQVISLNRCSPPRSGWIFPSLEMEEIERAEGVTTLEYIAPPHGLHHGRMLRQLGDAIANMLSSGRLPEILVGHKLGIEGIAVRQAAGKLGIPYALSLQGNTDEKILKARPDLRRLLAKVYHGAAHVFPFAPWALQSVERYLGKRAGATSMLPCAMADDAILPPREGNGRLLSVFHLRHARLKNLGVLGSATRISGVPLDIVGGGSATDEADARAQAGEEPEFLGAVDNSMIAERFNAASGFIMPSRRESFGLVFIEALFAGCPIAYPAGAAVDGYFDGCAFALRVDARDPTAVADAMLRMIAQEQPMKAALADWQQSAAARPFTRSSIAATFASGIEQALALPLGQV